MKENFILRKKWRFFLSFLFFLISIFFLFQNCGRYQTQVNQKKSLSSIQCKTQTSFTTPFEENKIQMENSLLNVETASENEQKTEPSETELGLVVDTSCLSSSENPVLVLGQVVEVPGELSQMKQVAINLSVQGEINFEQLTEDMKNPCLMGIIENKTVTQVHPPTKPNNPGAEEQVPTSLDSGSNHSAAKEQSSSTTSKFNDPLVKDQIHLDFLNHSQSVDLQNQITEQITSPVIVAVVGSGVDVNHPDLQGRLWDDGQGNHGKNFLEDNFDISDTNGGGTHQAGIIAAKQNNNIGIAGLAGDYVKIMTSKVFQEEASDSVTIYNGVRYAIENKADVINLNLIDGNLIILNEVVLEAVNEGIVVTMAVGDNGSTITLNNCIAPTCVGRLSNGALTVASLDTLTGDLSRLSNSSSEFVEIAAPGDGIISTFTNNTWEAINGTTSASSVVAAAAAFVIGFFKANNIDYTPESVENFLKDKGSRKSSSESVILGVQKARVIDFNVINENLQIMKPEKGCGS